MQSDLRLPSSIACGVLAAAAILASTAAASELSDDLRARRGRVMERLGPDTLYADIGGRIEDSYLAADQGVVNLSAAVPKTIEAVEAFLRIK